jgi:thiol-disulfide isomerase/thioredoxin
MAKTFKRKGKINRRTTRRRGSAPSFMKVDAAKDIPSFEKMLHKSPITIVMVYLGWCGHCQKAKPNFMNVAKKNHPGVSFALLNGDIQDQTSLKQIKVEGVPEFVVNANINGNIQSTKVPISYETDAIERLANASVATLNDLPPTIAISKKTPAEVLASVKRNNAGNMKLNKNNAASNSALPIPNTEVAMPESLMGNKEKPTAPLNVPKNSYQGPLKINSLNPMSATSPIATLMNINKLSERAENEAAAPLNVAPEMKQAGGNIQPRHDPKHPGKFILELPGMSTIRGSYSTIAKKLRKFEGV